MTAALTRLYRDMPQELSRADLDAATDAHLQSLRAAKTYADTQRGLYLRPVSRIRATEIKATRRRNRALFLAVALGLAVAVLADHLITQSNAARLDAEFGTGTTQ